MLHKCHERPGLSFPLLLAGGGGMSRRWQPGGTDTPSLPFQPPQPWAGSPWTKKPWGGGDIPGAGGSTRQGTGYRSIPGGR